MHARGEPGHRILSPLRPLARPLELGRHLRRPLDRVLDAQKRRRRRRHSLRAGHPGAHCLERVAPRRASGTSSAPQRPRRGDPVLEPLQCISPNRLHLTLAAPMSPLAPPPILRPPTPQRNQPEGPIGGTQKKSPKPIDIGAGIVIQTTSASGNIHPRNSESAEVAELVDALSSGGSGLTPVGVRVPPSASRAARPHGSSGSFFARRLLARPHPTHT